METGPVWASVTLGQTGKKHSWFRPKTGRGRWSHSAYSHPPPLSWPQRCGQNSSVKQQVSFGELSAVTYRRNLGPSAHLQRPEAPLSFTSSFSSFFFAPHPRFFCFCLSVFCDQIITKPWKDAESQTATIHASSSPLQQPIERGRKAARTVARLRKFVCSDSGSCRRPIPPLESTTQVKEEVRLPLCCFIIKAWFLSMCSFWTAD